MSTCLVALGSNLGDRRATLDAALAALAAAPATQLLCHSTWHRTQPVGMAGSLHEFLNGAALVETTLEPEALLEVLQRIETAHGRRPGQRWTDRTLDLDLLLVDQQIIDTPALVVPHARMSYRRFVLQPAAEIAGDFLHPVLGWTIDQLCEHLAAPGNLAAIVSPREQERSELVAGIAGQRSVELVDPPPGKEVSQLWPGESTTWFRVAAEGKGADASTAASQRPKLTILLNSGPTVERQPGRGPTLVLRDLDPAAAEREARAAVEAVWPDLGR